MCLATQLDAREVELEDMVDLLQDDDRPFPVRTAAGSTRQSCYILQYTLNLNRIFSPFEYILEHLKINGAL